MRPGLFQIGPVTIHAYGTMLALAFIVGIALLHRNVRYARGLKPDRVIDYALFVLLGSLIGARLMYVALNWHTFDSPIQIVYVHTGGLSFHGGVLGGILGIALFTRLYRTPFLPLADASAPSLALGYAITKWGCFLNGCCIGRPTDGPLGVVFHALGGDMGHVARHPVQIYDSLLNIALCVFLVLALSKRRHYGMIFQIYLILYSGIRFFVEFYRRGVSAWPAFGKDASAEELLAAPLFGGPLTQAQFASIIIAAVAIAWMLWRLRHPPEESPQLTDIHPDEAEDAQKKERPTGKPRGKGKKKGKQGRGQRE